MKLAIIGSNSFLARHLIRELGDTADLLLFSRSQPNKDLHTRAEWSEFDVQTTDIRACAERCLSVDVILYCVANGVQPDHRASNRDIWEANAFAPIALSEHLAECGFRGTLITFGSYFEYGNSPNTNTFDEQGLVSAAWPLPNAYCMSKRALTQYTSLRLQSGAPFRHFHFILTNVYGVGENQARLLPHIMSRVAENMPLNFSSGTQSRQYTHVRDIATWLAGFVATSADRHLSGIYNLSNDTQVPVRDLVELALRMVREEGFDVPESTFGSIDREDVAMRFLGVTSERARFSLSWNPRISLEQGVREYVGQLSAQGNT